MNTKLRRKIIMILANCIIGFVLIISILLIIELFQVCLK